MSALFMTATLMLAAADPTLVIANAVPFFERHGITEGVDVTAIAIIEDSRCPSGVLCIQAGRLVVGVIVNDGIIRHELKMEIGVPYRVEGGTIALVSAGTPPSSAGAIHLSKYALNFQFTPGPE